MAMPINTNVVSINAQRNLGLSGGSLSTTMQRLSSGLRVNSAKDDAAGLAIAERMNAQSKGLAIAARNANDGISLAQTTEGALGKIGDMLQRQRELAVQASNATNSDTDRAALQSELSQLTSEIDRVAKTTSFNGQKVLDGSFSGGVFQVGASAGDNITIAGTTKATANGLGDVKFGSTSSVSINAANIKDFDKALSGMSMEVGGKTIALNDVKAAASGEARLGQMVSAINEKTADTGVTAFLAKGAKDGEFTISLKSSSEGAVLLKGFDSLAGEPAPAVKSKVDFGAFEDAVAALNADNTSRTNADAVIRSLEAQYKNAAGYVEGGAPKADSAAATIKAALDTMGLKADGTIDTTVATTTVQSTAQGLKLNELLKADTQELNPVEKASKLDLAAAADKYTSTATEAAAVIADLEVQVQSATGYNKADPAKSTGVAKELATVIATMKTTLDGAGAFNGTAPGKNEFEAELGKLNALAVRDEYVASGPANPSNLNFAATESALDAFAVNKTANNAAAVVKALEDQIASASGSATEGVKKALTDVVASLTAQLAGYSNAGTGSATGFTVDASKFADALKENNISLSGLAALVKADEAALNPGAIPSELQAATDTVMKLNGESAVADVNKALETLNAQRVKEGQKEFETLAADAKPADVEAALKDIQGKLDTLGLNIGGTEVTKHKGIDTLDVSTQAGAWEAIKQIDSAIDQVNSARGDLGALQTRFEKTVENIDIQNENISAAKGRIVDADFATETANLSRAQILQQAGTAMVAQATQLPQQVLSLLR